MKKKLKQTETDNIIDNILVLFPSLHHLENFNEYSNTKHFNIEFTNEKEVNESLPVLAIIISQNNNSFTTTVYHKPTFRGIYSSFSSLIADETNMVSYLHYFF